MKFSSVRKSSLLFLAVLLGTAWTFASPTLSWANAAAYGHGKRPDAASFMWHILKAKEGVGLTDDQ